MKSHFQAPWNVKDTAIILIIVAILLATTVIATNFFDLKSIIETSNYKSIYLILIFLFQWILISIPLLILTLKKHKLSARNFGLDKISPLKTISLIIKGYLLFLAISLIITILILYTSIKIPGYQIQETILPLFTDTPLDLIIAGVVIIILAPILEELFFRGFLLRTLNNNYGPVLASITTAFIFAAIHMQPSSIIPIFILGLIINWIALKGKSILPAIGFHIFNNAIAFTIEVLIIKEVISFENLV